jgi:hypothetical protein
VLYLTVFCLYFISHRTVTFLDLFNDAVNCGAYIASKEAPEHCYECRGKRCSIKEAVEIYFKESAWNEENYDDFKWDSLIIKHQQMHYYILCLF